MVITPPEIEHTPLEIPSIEKVTGFPELPPVAVGVYVGPPYTAFVGAAEVNVMICPAFTTVTVPGLVADADTPPLDAVIVVEMTAPISEVVNV
jgi:hypothetical protein